MQWTIGKKLAAGFGIGMLLLLLISWVAYTNIDRVTATATLVGRAHEAMHTLEDTVFQLINAETGQRGYLLTGQDLYLDPYRAGVGALSRDLQSLRQMLADDATQMRRMDELTPLVDAKLAELKETIDLRQSQGQQAALRLVQTDRGKKIMDDIRRVVADMEAEEENLRKTRQEDADASSRGTKTVLLIGALLAAAIKIMVGTFLTLSITRPVTELVNAAQRIEKGDLRSEKLNITSNDEIGLLMGAFNRMQVSLRDLTRQSQAAAENLNAATSQISASTRQQTASLAEQLEAVQETSTTMEEVAQSGNQIADKARQVGTSAEASSTATINGLQAVQNTSRNMETIREQVEVVAENIVALSEKTQAIGEIIANVNDLAERSNLLALNAAIEAASVGEEGSRFSVVASELKNLADQSKSSTVQVRTILGDIQKGIHSTVMLTEEAVKRVESGRAQAEASEQVIRQTSESTQESVRAFQQIVAATNQQQIGFEQVSMALQNIRKAAEQSAKGVTQLDTASLNMNALAQQLRKAVERFQV